MNNKTEELKGGKEFTGKIVSLGGTKTAIVAVNHMWKHPLYKKSMRRTQRMPAHNELEGLKIGDTVTIAETKPISKTKFFKVLSKVE
jgi:small subunit ribosomal protein S17